MRTCAESNTLLVIDECFNEFLDDPAAHSAVGLLTDTGEGSVPSVGSGVNPPGAAPLIILKAFTKLYAMAGFRLGYALCGGPEAAEGIAGTGQAWSVSAIAQTAGLAAFNETAYVEELRRLIQAEREPLKAGLSALGFEVLGGAANYLFFKVPRTSAPHTRGLAPGGNLDLQSRRVVPPSLFQSLLDKGILIRSCANYPGLDNSFYRIAIRKPDENKALLDALGAIQKSRGHNG
jgi:threonine-phosphate decarboxylase